MPIFCGDVHGKFEQYKKIIKQHKNTIQVGDMGVGFRRWPHGEWSQNPPYALMVEQNARFIRGNHDNPNVCAGHSQCIPDGKIINDMMFVGGAYSIDWKYRIPEYDWWDDEEIPQEWFDIIKQAYSVMRPACMVTHDCPYFIYPMIHSHHFVDIPSRTPKALEAMWQMHKPKVWVFGHHHKSFDQIVDGTRFVCLAELEVKEINWLTTEK